MKKIFAAIIMTLIMVFSLTACGSKSESGSSAPAQQTEESSGQEKVSDESEKSEAPAENYMTK